MLVTCGSVTGLISGLCLGKLAKYSLEQLQSDKKQQPAKI